MARSRKRKAASGDVATNRQASYRYNLLERFECGIALTGTEVKSLRDGNAQLKDAYAVIRDGEVWLLGLYIAPYGPASRENHDPERPRSSCCTGMRSSAWSGGFGSAASPWCPRGSISRGLVPGPRSRSR